jgi:hypothetical protein
MRDLFRRAVVSAALASALLPAACGPATTTATGAPAGLSTAAPAAASDCAPAGRATSALVEPPDDKDEKRSQDVQGNGAAYVITKLAGKIRGDVAVTLSGRIATGDTLFLYSRNNRFKDPALDDGTYYVKELQISQLGCEHWQLNFGDDDGKYGYELFGVVMDDAAKRYYADGTPGRIWAMRDLNGVGNARWDFKIDIPL